VELGYGVWIARIDISYLKSAHADDELTIYSRPVKKGAVSGDIEQLIKRGDEDIARARVTWAFVNAEGKPTRIPQEFNVPGLSPDTN
jgi:acyl-CoA thioester hydrolase